MEAEYTHLFGPVPSRRLGLSLGVDLVPYKVCSFDCVFCQLGRTTEKTVHRREYVDTDSVLAELDSWITAGGHADYITLSGSGEPTLNTHFGAVIDFVRKRTEIPVALLTNGSLLVSDDVRHAAVRADVVKVSLSAWDQTSLQHINRPAPGIEFESQLEGQRLLRKEYSGEIWMEVFLVWGMNTTGKDVQAIAELAKSVGPDRIQLNTAIRPPCEAFVEAVPRDLLAELALLFDPPAEIIAEFSSDRSESVKADETAVLGMLQRRPCTLDDICTVFGMHRNEALKYVGKLTRTGLALQHAKQGRTYFYAKRGSDEIE